MKFEVITTQESEIKSENFFARKIKSGIYSSSEGECIIVKGAHEELEVLMSELDELIQLLLLYRQHNVEYKKEEVKETKEI